LKLLIYGIVLIICSKDDIQKGTRKKQQTINIKILKTIRKHIAKSIFTKTISEIEDMTLSLVYKLLNKVTGNDTCIMCKKG